MASIRLGRPTKIDGQVLSKLEEAFALGCSDQEACIYAGISQAGLYRFQEQSPEFRERKALLKQWPVLRARKAVVEALDSDPHLAFKYLERKRREEFYQRTLVDSNESDEVWRVIVANGNPMCQKYSLEAGNPG